MENKEFFAQITKLVRSGASADKVRNAVFEARKQTQMTVGKDGFRMDTLSGDFVVEYTLEQLAYVIEKRNEAGEAGYKKTLKEVKKLIKHEKGKPAQSLCKFIEKYYDENSVDLTYYNVFVNAALKLEKMGYPHPDATVNPIKAFMIQSLQFFEENSGDLLGHSHPILPLVATAVLARAMFDPDQKDTNAIRCADEIEDFIEDIIAAYVDMGKAGNVKENISQLVNDATEMSARLLWALDQDEEFWNDEEYRLGAKIPQYYELDSTYKPAERYLHDIALFRKLNENTLNESQRSNSLIKDNDNELCYVGFAGELIPVFTNSRHDNAQDSAKLARVEEKYGHDFALLLALAQNNGPVVLDLLDKEPSDLIKSVVGLMAIRYCGSDKKDLAELAEALGDVYGEEEVRDQDFAEKAISAAREFAEGLKTVRDKTIAVAAKDKDLSTKRDQNALAMMRSGLANLEADVATKTTAVAPARTVTFTGRKTKTPEQIEAETLRKLIELAHTALSKTGVHLLKKGVNEDTLKLTTTGLEFRNLTPRVVTGLIQDKSLSKTMQQKMSPKTVELIDNLINADRKDAEGNDIPLEQVAAKQIAQVFELEEDEIKQ